jgi:glycine cleavage system H protein
VNPADLRYTKEHEWVRLEGDTALFGITDYAQNELGDVVFVELPPPGTQVQQGESFGVVESVKAASDLYAPLSGEVVDSNTALTDEPDLVNKDPFAGGWMIRIRPSNSDEMKSLLEASQYDEFLETLH